MRSIRRRSCGPSSFPNWPRSSDSKPLHRWQAYSRQLRNDPALMAYYTFEKHRVNTSTLPNVGCGQRVGRAGRGGRMGSRAAARQVRPVLPRPRLRRQGRAARTARFNFTGPFSFAVWFKVAQFSPNSIPALVARAASTWQLERCGKTNCLTLDSTGDDPVLQAAAPYGGHRSSLASGGRRGRASDGSHGKHCTWTAAWREKSKMRCLGCSDEPVWLGAMSTYPGREFEGRIDKAMIFARGFPLRRLGRFPAGTPPKGPQTT